MGQFVFIYITSFFYFFFFFPFCFVLVWDLSIILFLFLIPRHFRWCASCWSFWRSFLVIDCSSLSWLDGLLLFIYSNNFCCCSLLGALYRYSRWTLLLLDCDSINVLLMAYTYCYTIESFLPGNITLFCYAAVSMLVLWNIGGQDFVLF